MSETLYVEGADRFELIAQVRAEYGPSVKITALRRVRRGGVLGFFAREYDSIGFEVPDQTAATDPAPRPVGRHAVHDESTLTIEDLIDRSNSADGPVSASGRPATQIPQSNSQFADLLSRLVAAAPAAREIRGEEPEPAWAELADPPPPVDRPPVDRRPAARATGPGAGPTARVRFDTLADLRALGVPLTISSEINSTSLLAAIEEIVSGLPVAPEPPAQAGDLIVIAGAADQLEVAVAQLAVAAHVPADAVWHASQLVSGKRTITGPLDAARQALTMRAGATASIIAVELERPPVTGRYSWSSQVIAALGPTAVWAAVDAGRKTDDLRAELDRLGAIDALIVAGAGGTCSPASVWDLDIPIGILDGRRASAGCWAGMLLDALDSQARP